MSLWARIVITLLRFIMKFGYHIILTFGLLLFLLVSEPVSVDHMGFAERVFTLLFRVP